MRVSLRSMLIAGVSTLAISSLAVAPVQPLPQERVAAVSAPVHLAASVQPLRPADVASALAEVNSIADELDMPLAIGDVAAQNAASDFVTWVYAGIIEWADYFALELAPWALGWIPFGNIITNQIYALYPPFIDFTDSIVFDLIDPVLNDPLNLSVWANGLSAVAYTAVASLLNAGINEINLVINYFLSWLPPLPPIPPWPPLVAAADPTLAATADVANAAALPGLVGGPITAVADVAANLARTALNLWYVPAGVVDSGVGFVSNTLGAFSFLPLVGVADFQLNEVWGLIHTGGNTLAGLTNDLIDIANGLVSNTVQDGLAPALEDAFYTALQSLQTHGSAAVDALTNFTLDQVQYLTGVWVPHTTSPRVDLPQGPPNQIRYTVPQVLRDVLGPLAGLLPSGTLGSVPLSTAVPTSDTVSVEATEAGADDSAPGTEAGSHTDTVVEVVSESGLDTDSGSDGDGSAEAATDSEGGAGQDTAGQDGAGQDTAGQDEAPQDKPEPTKKDRESTYSTEGNAESGAKDTGEEKDTGEKDTREKESGDTSASDSATDKKADTDKKTDSESKSDSPSGES